MCPKIGDDLNFGGPQRISNNSVVGHSHESVTAVRVHVHTPRNTAPTKNNTMGGDGLAALMRPSKAEARTHKLPIVIEEIRKQRADKLVVGSVDLHYIILEYSTVLE